LPDNKRTSDGKTEAEISKEGLEKAKRWFETDDGKEFLRLHERVTVARDRERAFIEDFAKYMLHPEANASRLYLSIGKFIVRFSQLEAWIRLSCLGFFFETDPDAVLILVESYDFRALVGLTRTLYERKFSKTSDIVRAASSVFKQCLDINDQRVRLVHSTWILSSPDSFGALHTGRQNFRSDVFFKQIEEIERVIEKIEKVETELRKILSGEYDKEIWDELDG